jgi:MoxR-like ATPase
MSSSIPFELFTNELPEQKMKEECYERRKKEWPPAPPWRQFIKDDKKEQVIPEDTDKERWEILNTLVPPGSLDAQRGSVFRLPRDGQGLISEDGKRIRDAVNAAIHLRRPLLVTGDPGSGKTSLAYAIAWELGLGPVLKWPITARSRLLEDGLYSYDALGRLQDTQLDQMQDLDPSVIAAEPGDPSRRRTARSIGDYITLGPVGTAFLPSRFPRVLLIDEIDKSDLQLPNELLQLFEEGEYLIKELFRDSARRKDDARRIGSSSSLGAKDSTGSAADTEQTMDEISVRTIEKESPSVPIRRGIVRCAEFPIVVMTSNRERDFPPAFNRRCLRVEMPKPTEDSLLPLVLAHFSALADEQNKGNDTQLKEWIKDFVSGDTRRDRATDQLLNAIYLRTNAADLSLTEQQIKEIEPILYKGLKEMS